MINIKIILQKNGEFIGNFYINRYTLEFRPVCVHPQALITLGYPAEEPVIFQESL
jgi:hypothetical protein